jgi:hypothetical protein
MQKNSEKCRKNQLVPINAKKNQLFHTESIAVTKKMQKNSIDAHLF